MNKAIFYDRDGTLNEDEGYTYKVEDFKFIPGAIEALKKLKDKYIFFIITNQSGIGRGYFTIEDVNKFNNHLVKELNKHDIKIQKVYICPHEPDDRCDCRKPLPKYLNEAKNEFDIDMKSSWVIGDHDSDIKLGKNAGTRSILVLTGHGKKHFNDLKTKPDYIANDILDAAKFIIKNE